MTDFTSSAARSATPAPTITVATRNERRAEYWTAVSNAVLLDASLSDAAVRLYALLLMYANQGDGCTLAQRDIARDMGRSERSIRRTLDELEAAGLVTSEQPGLTLPNVYLVEPSRKPATPGGTIPTPRRPVSTERTKMAVQLRSGALSGQKWPVSADKSGRSGPDKNDRSFKEKNIGQKKRKEEKESLPAALGEKSQEKDTDKDARQRAVYQAGAAKIKAALDAAQKEATRKGQRAAETRRRARPQQTQVSSHGVGPRTTLG